ncbi:FAD/NAD(P)-binding protein [Corynebacterium urealyticum]|uniref:FAD/NAD(P)-binding protein n=1 Tax=Corynebacterium urealyticum TaxID=43771 RepID=UPI00293E5980|nr:FAD/NAD(P)-binding protein [Corynebacterium urealyticum]WOH94647.1 FAD/NAD(P)-binding protein [Corynebacterium urealyticum]
MSSIERRIAIIGAGPRGISVLERIVATHRELVEQGTSPERLAVAVVDDVQPGAGRIWRTDQNFDLCMNTLADAVTLFPEPGSSVYAPVLEGPTMYEWIMLVRGEELGEQRDPRGAKAALFSRHPVQPLDHRAQNIQQAEPNTHPPRGLYGEYLRWVFSAVLGMVPEAIEVTVHRSKAVGIEAAADGTDTIELADGTRLHAHATVLALGWLDTDLAPEEQELAAAAAKHEQLEWVAPNNPADQDFSAIPSWEESGQEILIRGLGMGFFDAMSMLTLGRGGAFIPDATAPAGLRYQPSGREPRILAMAGRGYPHQPRPEFSGMPPRAELRRLDEAISQLDIPLAPNSLDFGDTLWPALLRDAQEAYYRVLLAAEPDVLKKIREIIDDPATDALRIHEDTRLDGLVDPEKRFNIPWENDPVARLEDKAEAAGEELSIDSFTRSLFEHLLGDWREAQRGEESPVKMGLFTFGAAMKRIALVDEPGRFTQASREEEYALFGSIAQMVSVGPPAFRTAELLALIDAGLVRFLGAKPGLTVDEEIPAFRVSSATTGEEVCAPVLIEALIHDPDVRHTACPLSRQLLAQSRMRAWAWGDGSPSGAPEVDRETGLLIGASGQRDPRVHMLGVPLREVRADMTNSPKVGEDPVIFQETDAAARSALRIAMSR